jgi:hypothetical protein
MLMLLQLQSHQVIVDVVEGDDAEADDDNFVAKF